MKILGIHYETHDSGATILNSDKIIAAIAEERLSRKKEDGAFPFRAIKEVLTIANLNLDEIDYIAISGEKNIFKYLYFHAMYVVKPLFYSIPTLLATKNPGLILKTFFNNFGAREIAEAYKKRKCLSSFLEEAKRAGFRGKIIYVDHDKSHAASAYFSSGWTDCLIPVFEGYSLKNASSIWIGSANKLKKVKAIKWPHSPGHFYRCVTMLLGFSPRRHAGKITGLAAYGKAENVKNKVASLMSYRNGTLRVHPRINVLQYEYLHTKQMPSYFAGYTKEDLAAGFQHVLEQCLVEMVRDYVDKYKFNKVAMAGGVVGNVKLNQRIAALDNVLQLHVHPAMSDSGQATGAAISVAFDLGLINMVKISPIENVYFGTSIDNNEAQQELKKSGLQFNQPNELAKKVAELLSQQKVVAVCRGSMEYGPRSLGNRSILYSPIDASVNKWLNERLNRTEFMPFAPVTLFEHAHDCYDNKMLTKVEDAASFMTVSIDCSDAMKRTQPAVVHIDGTARPQLIRRETNEFYYDTLSHFFKITSVPSLVNTSFNMHEEPIVCSVEDAVRSFLASKIDYLVLGDYLVQAPETTNAS